MIYDSSILLYLFSTAYFSYILFIFEGKKAPPTPKKIASTANSEVNFQGVVDLKAYHASLDEWAIEIIEMIDKDLSQRVLSPEGIIFYNFLKFFR